MNFSKAQRRRGARRLQILADDILAKLPKEAKVEMEQWGTHKGTTPPSSKPECGTAYCACGYGAISKKLPGLTGDWRSYTDQYDGITYWYLILRAKVGGEEYQDWNAATAYFALNDDEAEHLFSVDSYRADLTQGQLRNSVIRRIRAHAKKQLVE